MALTKNTIHVLFLALLFLAGCQSTPDTVTGDSTSEEATQVLTGQSGVEDEVSNPNILQVAIGSKDHTTLVAAVTAAKLQDALTNAGPLTVFAPTNAAFEKLPAGTVEDLLKPENISALKSVLLYHVAPGSYTGDNIKGVMGIGQATGDKLKVEDVNGEVIINGGTKILASIKTSNGYIHVVDQVLLAPKG